MAALTSNTIRRSRGRDAYGEYEVTNTSVIYAGSLVGLDESTGRLVLWADTASFKFLGISDVGVTGDTGATPTVKARALESGVILENVSVTGASAIANQGDLVFATTDNDLTLTATTNVNAIGYVKLWRTSTNCDVQLFTPSEYQTQAKGIAAWTKDTADAAAATATAEHSFYTARDKVAIRSIRIQPDAALTADAANNATITIARRAGDGTGKVTVVTFVTNAGGTGSWVAFTALESGALSNATLTPGQKLTVEITKAGAGVVVPSFELDLELVVKP